MVGWSKEKCVHNFVVIVLAFSTLSNAMLHPGSILVMVEEFFCVVGWSKEKRVHNFAVIGLASTLSTVRELLKDLCRHGSDSEKHRGGSEVTTAAPSSLV